MVCAVIYDYRNISSAEDSESLSVSNNNEQRSTFVDKHLDEQRITVNQDNDKELMEKIETGRKLTRKKSKRIEDKG